MFLKSGGPKDHPCKILGPYKHRKGEISTYAIRRKKSEMLQKGLVQFWQFCGSLRLLYKQITSSPLLYAIRRKKSEMLQKGLVQLWHFCGSLGLLYNQIMSSPLLYAIWRKKSEMLQKGLVQFWHFCGSLRHLYGPNYVSFFRKTLRAGSGRRRARRD